MGSNSLLSLHPWAVWKCSETGHFFPLSQSSSFKNWERKQEWRGRPKNSHTNEVSLLIQPIIAHAPHQATQIRCAINNKPEDFQKLLYVRARPTKRQSGNRKVLHLQINKWKIIYYILLFSDFLFFYCFFLYFELPKLWIYSPLFFLQN